MVCFLDSPLLIRRMKMLEAIFEDLRHKRHKEQLEVLAAWLPLESVENMYNLNIVEKGKGPKL